MPQDTESLIFEALAINEEMAGKLYQFFAEKFPEHGIFWMELSAAEFRHAKWLRGMLNQINNGSMAYVPGRLKIEAIKSFTLYLNDRITQTKNGKIDLDEAISLALDIEQSLIERKYFEISKGMTTDMKKVITALADETERHYSALQKFVNQNRPAKIIRR
jgi:rubrerythrin